MGIIAALKKRYKYLYLKGVLDFTNLTMNRKLIKRNKQPDSHVDQLESFTVNLHIC
ncbi:hypothetical protein Plhal304r1_c044g0124471 [Plasmopara halstedii]